MIFSASPGRPRPTSDVMESRTDLFAGGGLKQPGLNVRTASNLLESLVLTAIRLTSLTSYVKILVNRA